VALGNKKVVPFNSNAGIPHDLTRKLLAKGLPFGLTEIFPFSVEKIIIAEWVHLKCRYGCNQYNTNWCCPPATPSIETVRGILSEYSRAILLTGRQKTLNFYRNNKRKRAMQVRCWKGTVSIERMLFLEGYYKAFSLVGESCALCKTCAYPDDCKFPQEKRPSVESFSIDVIGTLKNLGIASGINNDIHDEFNYYGIILVE
jgi:predicted metal-binding protein